MHHYRFRDFWYCSRDFWSCIYESPDHLLRRWYTVFALAILNFGILFLWLYERRADRELARNFQVDPSRRQVGHPWHTLCVVRSHHASQNSEKLLWSDTNPTSGRLC